ncbi:glycosyltransferase family 4 protein [Cohnella faecalis]|uniref:Glycosyltransferase n=1 Tax=Cohnella faecalis TaxID=2315694 RepID=A0A398CNB5_9BACL|nr:glycosyltransferase family 4 protein [Cohnella faecalis]RIE03802.1 glycosyltransferase [Cohnella faecalis]
MKILLTIHHYLNPNAGAEGVTMQLAEAYRRLGHEAELFAYDHLPKKLPFHAKRLLFPYFVSRALRSAAAAYDIVDASSGDAWVWATAGGRGRRKGPTLVARSHGLEHLVHEVLVQRAKDGQHRLSWKYPIYHGGFRLWEVAQSFRKADGAVFLNQAEQSYGRDKFGMNFTAVIGNGIPAYLIGREIAQTPLEADSNVAIAVVGRYGTLKGSLDAAKALAPLMRSRANVTVTFLGTQCEASKVHEDYPAELHARIRVIPRYKHEELPELLKGHHIKLFATVKEGFGMALVEAMACGLAPVTTKIPGPSDIVTDGHDGFLLAPGDADGMYRALDKLVSDRPLLNRIRTEAYRTAQRYGWDDIARRTLAYYEECRDNKRRKSSS